MKADFDGVEVNVPFSQKISFAKCHCLCKRNEKILKAHKPLPAVFATKAFAAKVEEGVKKEVIWHTQGSGKTALPYYNVKTSDPIIPPERHCAKLLFLLITPA